MRLLLRVLSCLGRVLLCLCLCLLLILVIVLLLPSVVLLVELGVANQGARCRLRMEGLVLVRILGVGNGGVVALVLLLLRWVLLWQTLMFWAVAIYPALLVAPLRAHSSEWGPIVLSLVGGAGRKLRRMTLVLRVFGGHLGGGVVFLL